MVPSTDRKVRHVLSGPGVGCREVEGGDHGGRRRSTALITPMRQSRHAPDAYLLFLTGPPKTAPVFVASWWWRAGPIKWHWSG